MANKTTNATSNNSFANLLQSMVIPEKSPKGAGFAGIYKKDVYKSLSALDERGAKSIRKKLRNERNALIIEGFQNAKKGEENFKDWVKRIWIPFAEKTYQNPEIFFEENGKTSPEKLGMLRNFSTLLKACK